MADQLTPRHAKTAVFLSRSAPYGTDRAATCLEMALACAAFEQHVKLVFMGDGVYQLLAPQDASTIEQKNLTAHLKAMPLYGIERVYVERTALAQRGLTADDLVVAAENLDDEQLRSIVHAADAVFTL